MPSHKRRNGSGRKPEGKFEKHRAKYLQALSKHPKHLQAVYEPSASIMEAISSTVAHEEMHLSSNSPVQLNANQLRQRRKLNRRRVISNSEIALRRHQLKHASNIHLGTHEVLCPP